MGEIGRNAFRTEIAADGVEMICGRISLDYGSVGELAICCGSRHDIKALILFPASATHGQIHPRTHDHNACRYLVTLIAKIHAER